MGANQFGSSLSTAPSGSRPLQRLAKGVGWVGLAQGAQAFVQIAALVCLARWLTPAEFGVATAATIGLQLMLLLAEFGIAPSIVHRPQLSERDVAAAQTHAFMTHAAIGALGLFSAPHAAIWLDIAPLAEVIPVLCAVVLLRGVVLVCEAHCHRRQQFRQVATVEIVSFLLGYLPTALILGAYGASYWALVLAAVAQVLLGGVLWILSGQILWRASWQPLDCRYGIAQTFSRLGSWLAVAGDALMVAALFSDQRLGEYGRAQQLMVAPASQLAQVIDRVLFPVMTQHHAGDDVNRLFIYFLRVVLMVALPFSVWLALHAGVLVEVLLGAGWHEVVLPSSILALGVAARLIHRLCDATLRARGIALARAWRQWVYALLVLGGCWLIAPLGLLGVAVAATLAAWLDAWLMLQLCKTQLRINYADLRDASLPALLVTALTAAMTWLATHFFPTDLMGRVSGLVLSLVVISVLLYGSRAWWWRTQLDTGR